MASLHQTFDGTANVENQQVIKHMGEGASGARQVSAPESGRREQAGEIYRLLIEKGYLNEDQLRYAKRVHSKLTGNQSLTQVLQDLKFITREQLQDTLSESRINLKIGTLLVELGLVTRNDLETAILRQKESQTRKTIGEILIEGGFIDERSLCEVLSYQLGFPFCEIQAANLDRQLLRRAPARWYAMHQFLPVGFASGKVTVAFIDPLNHQSAEAAEKVFGEFSPAICSRGNFAEILSILERDVPAQKAAEIDEKSIVGMVNSIFDEAIKSKSSDIHIEPMRDRVRVRLRIDGVLIHHKDLPVETGPPLSSRIKIMSKADIAERRRHQGGRILFENPKTGATLDMRVSFFVTVWGEKIVIRLLNQKGLLLSLNEIGMYPKMLERFRFNALDFPSGVILITGPTGSGKTTTLYSAVNYLENPNTSIVTVEDPVEYVIDGISQCSIDPKINLTFEESLRHVVRQDPDVIVIGEVRDGFSAETCIQASLTGHKVISTFHTEDSVGCLIRLLNMNIEAFLISSTVVCVVAQRLLRRVCKHCAEDYTPSPIELHRLGMTAAEVRGVNFKVGRGCAECRFTGYKGRVGVFELLVLNEAVKDAILKKATSYEIRRISTETSGLVTLLEDGVVKAANGVTSLQEVFRSLPHVSKPRSIHELRRLLGAD
jgi:type IV pilus assembly protein PilB